MVSSDAPVAIWYLWERASTLGVTEIGAARVPIWRERHGKYAFDVTVEDHRCPTRSQVPDTTNGIKTTVSTNHKRQGSRKLRDSIRRGREGTIILEFNGVDFSGVTFLK